MSDDLLYSYDPRQWAAAWSPPAPGETGGSPGRRLRAIAAACAIGVVLAGGGVARLSRGGVKAPTPTTVAAIAPEPAGPATVRRTFALSDVAELRGALERLGVPAALARQVDAAARPGLRGTGDLRAVLEMAQADGALRFQRLEVSNADSSGAIVRLTDTGQLATERLAQRVSERITVLHGVMDGDSFYTSAVAIGVPNSIISPFAKALSFDIDFQRDVAAGDAFELAYAQSVNAAGEAVGVPTIIYASLTTATKSAAVYRFQKAGDQADWYDASGSTAARSLMRTPVDGARITSKFGMRFHPVLHYTRLHGGVDFAAPIGTPVYAAADGVVASVSPSHCAGNMAIVDHANGMETRYFHLIHYADGLRVGQHVPQGYTLGWVGVTGICTTGPHLHYEIHINGERVDPLSVQPDAGGGGRRSQVAERRRSRGVRAPARPHRRRPRPGREISGLSRRPSP